MVVSSAIKIDLVGVQIHMPTIIVFSFYLRDAVFGCSWDDKSDALLFPLTPGGFHNFCQCVRQAYADSAMLLTVDGYELVPVLIVVLPALELHPLVK